MNPKSKTQIPKKIREKETFGAKRNSSDEEQKEFSLIVKAMEDTSVSARETFTGTFTFTVQGKLRKRGVRSKEERTLALRVREALTANSSA